MKKLLFLFGLILIGLPTVFADTTCTYTYTYSEYYLGSEETNEAAEGATIELKMPSKEAKVTKRANNKFLFFDMSFSFGNSDTIDWSKNTCPLYIAAYAEKADWYGFDEKPNLSSFVEKKDTKALSPTGIHIFMNDNPSEDIYTCNYDGFSIVFDSEGKAISVNDKLSSSAMVYNYSLDNSLKDFPAEVPGKCENVYTCVTGFVTPSGGIAGYKSFKIYSGSMDLASKQDTECIDSIMTLFSVQIDEEISKEEGDNSVCRTYSFRWSLLEEMHNDCVNNVSSCTIYNNYKNNLKKWCNNVTKFVDHGDMCLEKCLNLSKEINKLEKTSPSISQCGLSQKLILWVANIVKWVKYIIPVIVIVLGILDFIKAIAADKEDEMKKAQGHFVKRLIAAALIFIIPFIIEFVLNKMGFDSNGCGIIDL